MLLAGQRRPLRGEDGAGVLQQQPLDPQQLEAGERGADGAPNYGATPRQLCPYALSQGATIMDGPVYRYNADASDNSRRWPAVNFS